MKNEYINIKAIAQAKGLKSTRSIRMEINKPESKYISREVKVNGGTSYEILFSSLEPELQQKLRENETKSTALVPLNYQPTTFVSESARLRKNLRGNLVLYPVLVNLVLDIARLVCCLFVHVEHFQ